MEPPTGLIPWFSKTEGNTYATLLHHRFLFKGKPTHAQEVANPNTESAQAWTGHPAAPFWLLNHTTCRYRLTPLIRIQVPCEIPHTIDQTTTGSFACR